MAVVRMSDEAKTAWMAIAQRHGVTLAALLEAMVPYLPLPSGTDEELTPLARAILEDARAIMVDRLARG